MQNITRYYNARILLNHALVHSDLWVQEGILISPQPKADRDVDVQGMIIAPGFIDLQINGAFNVDFSSNPQGVEKVAQLLPQYGVTSFLPTVISLKKKEYPEVIRQLKQYIGKTTGAHVLGIHLEGPFFNAKYVGAHLSTNVVEVPLSVQDFYGTLDGVKIVTLAPELPHTINAMKQLNECQIVISAGHTNASYQEMQEAYVSGLSLTTHLYNAMSVFHHRSPGTVGATLNSNAFYTLIVDDIHVHPAMVNLAWKANAKGLILVTDAIQALGMQPGIYRLGDVEVEVKEDKATVVGSDTIAGSVLSMDKAVRNFKNATHCSIVDALEVASLHPAQVLNLKTKGNLNIGSDADFIILNDDLFVEATYVAGERAWKRS